jgi:hypothetical protein
MYPSSPPMSPMCGCAVAISRADAVPAAGPGVTGPGTAPDAGAAQAPARRGSNAKGEGSAAQPPMPG